MKKTLMAALAIASLLSAGRAMAAEKIIYRGGLAFVSPTSDSTIDGTKFELDSALGIDLNFEYQFSKAWGIEAAIEYAKHDVKADGVKGAEISNTPILFSANYHIPTNGKLDFYVGPTLGYSFWGDLKPDTPGNSNVSIKGNFVWGVNAGLDVPFNDNWAFTTGVRYLGNKAKTDEPGLGNESIDVNPFVLRAGVAYRF